MQDGAARADCPKVWKTLMSIDISRKQDDKVQRTLICPAAAGVPCEGQALALRLRRRAARATVVRGPVPRDLSLILAILRILAILLQTRDNY